MSVDVIISSLVGAIFSGVLATIITLFVNHQADIKKMRRDLAAEIFGARFLINKGQEKSEVFYTALNKIPIVFHKNKRVMDAYTALFNASMMVDGPLRSKEMNDCMVSFLKALCEATGIACKEWNDSKVMNVFGA